MDQTWCLVILDTGPTSVVFIQSGLPIRNMRLWHILAIMWPVSTFKALLLKYQVHGGGDYPDRSHCRRSCPLPRASGTVPIHRWTPGVSISVDRATLSGKCSGYTMVCFLQACFHALRRGKDLVGDKHSAFHLKMLFLELDP